MAELKKMYKGIANSPQTYLTQSLVEEGTVIYIADGRALGTLPNLAVIGDDVNAETILVNSKREDGGYEVTRAIEGSAKAWDRMSVIARNYTNYDDETIKDNIMLINEESSKNKGDIEVANQEIQGIKNKNSEIETEVSSLKSSIETISDKQDSVTHFSADKIIKDSANYRFITIFNVDGSITEEVRAKEGNALISTKTTTFEADGSVKEVIS